MIQTCLGNCLMKQTIEFYDERAKEAASDAKKATLENVKERNLRAEKTWRGLADQARRVALERAKAEREKEKRRIAESHLT